MTARINLQRTETKYKEHPCNCQRILSRLFSKTTALLDQGYDKQTLDQSLNLPVKPLLDLFVKNQAAPSKGIVISLEHYMELVDWTGRAIIDGKRGYIPDQLSPIISRLQVNPNYWVKTVNNFNRCFPRVAGRIDRLKMICQKLNLAWIHGMGASKCLFVQPV